MTRPPASPLGARAAHAAVVGGLLGGTVGLAISIPFAVGSPFFGLLFVTAPAFTYGNAIGAITGALTVIVLTPLPVRGRMVASIVGLVCGVVVASVTVGLPLPWSARALYLRSPEIIVLVVSLAGIAAAIAARRIPVAVKPTPPEQNGRQSGIGNWLLLVGMIPPLPTSMLAISGEISRTLGPSMLGEQPDPIDPTVAFVFCAIAAATLMVLVGGLGLVVRDDGGDAPPRRSVIAWSAVMVVVAAATTVLSGVATTVA